FEDTALARAWRSAGFQGLCLDGQQVVRVRMYESLGGIWRGFLKNAYPAFRHELSFWLFLTFHALIFLLPFLAIGGLATLGRISGFAVGAALWALLGRALLAARFRYSFWSIFLHPLAECGLIAVALASRLQCRRGGVEWKGRVYRSRTP
ncbi:MAG: hypothetical protein U1E27_05875, partial [Kiritimatiellia bacterium]|nr:hypothetical protein [Kiritimatiellia bacterium]